MRRLAHRCIGKQQLGRLRPACKCPWHRQFQERSCGVAEQLLDHAFREIAGGSKRITEVYEAFHSSAETLEQQAKTYGVSIQKYSSCSTSTATWLQVVCDSPVVHADCSVLCGNSCGLLVILRHRDWLAIHCVGWSLLHSCLNSAEEMTDLP